MSPSFQYIAIDEPLTNALANGRFEDEYSLSLGANADFIDEVCTQMIRLLRDVPRPAPWGGYLAADESTRTLVGTCAFKAAPNEQGEVEIAYCTFPEFEGRGYATMMATHLCQIAEDSPEVSEVLAHTLPEANASTRVLSKCGFEFVKEIFDDPEDGHIWRWRRLSR